MLNQEVHQTASDLTGRLMLAIAGTAPLELVKIAESSYAIAIFPLLTAT